MSCGSTCEAGPGGAKVWRDRRGRWHRGGDMPAVVRPDGVNEWWQNGERHREGGPAVVRRLGGREWYWRGQRHREGGPAVTRPGGHEEWWVDGRRHREDGPAYVRAAGGAGSWFLRGRGLSAREGALRWARSKALILVCVSAKRGKAWLPAELWDLVDDALDA